MEPPSRTGARGLEGLSRLADSYGVVLGLLVVDYVVLSAGRSGPWVIVVDAILVVTTTIAAFRASLVRGRVLVVLRLVSALALISAIVAALLGSTQATGITFALLCLLIISCPVVILARISQHTRVRGETILGAISVYVLIGLVYTCSDLSYALISGNSFFAQPGNRASSDFLYFSFITMTTVGYGDLSPATGLPRTLAVLEALTGQIFLVVLVSRLVAMYSPSQQRRRLARIQERLYEPDSEEAEPDPADPGPSGPTPGGSRDMGGPDSVPGEKEDDR